MNHKNRKNNHIIKSDIYTKYIRSKIFPVKMPEKMIEDLKVLAKEQNTNVSQMIRETLFEKYNFKLTVMNKPEQIYWHGSIEDMPLTM